MNKTKIELKNVELIEKTRKETAYPVLAMHFLSRGTGWKNSDEVFVLTALGERDVEEFGAFAIGVIFDVEAYVRGDRSGRGYSPQVTVASITIVRQSSTRKDEGRPSPKNPTLPPDEEDLPF
jgi:hypothetical protein